ncbi:MAG: hypothetical protein NC913_03315 [Candidatus Omnitrophica bacterium]|nr:hypothetical protein [Candidatus Omnitrophota bacterium]
MKRSRRKVPDWITNLSLIGLFMFCYLIIYSKTLALGYKVSELERNYQQLKNWNQYYRSQILKELSLEKVKERAIKMNLSLEIPTTWRIITFVSSETDIQKDNNAHAEESK